MDAAILQAERDAADASRKAEQAHDQLIEWTEGERKVIRSLKAIGHVLQGAEFARVSSGFVEQHKQAFTFEDENKLEYTALHEKYVELMEETIMRLASDVDMDELLAHLPEFMRDRAHSGNPENTGATIDFLLSLTDFTTFKNMMLGARLGDNVDEGGSLAAAQSEEAIGALSTELKIPAAVVERARVLLRLTSADANVAWHHISEKKGEYSLEDTTLNGVKYMRSHLLVPLDARESLRCHFNWVDPELCKWDDKFEKIEPISDVRDGPVHDQLFRVYLKLPGVVKLVPSVPKSVVMRMVCQEDVPSPGACTIVMTTWDQATDRPEGGKMSMVRAALVVPNGEGRSHMYNVSQMPSAMPGWVAALFMTNTIIKSFPVVRARAAPRGSAPASDRRHHSRPGMRHSQLGPLSQLAARA